MPTRQFDGPAPNWNSVQLALQAYARVHHLSTRDLASKLGLEHSYVHRILKGERRGMSARTIAKVEELTGQSMMIGPGTLSWRRADAELDRGVHAFFSGNFEAAETHFAHAYETADETSSGRYVAAKAKSWHAGIIRDRNALWDNPRTGVRGAISIYREVAEAWSELAPELLPETEFMLAACDEMLSRNELALDQYRSLRSDVADSLRDDRLLARMNARTGALETKMGLLAPARGSLERAIRIARHLEDAVPFSFAQEKWAIWNLRNGQLDEAWTALHAAEESVPSPGGLKIVQGLCIRADLMEREGEPGKAFDLLQSAALICGRDGFAHQGHYVAKRLKQLGREQVS